MLELKHSHSVSEKLDIVLNSRDKQTYWKVFER